MGFHSTLWYFENIIQSSPFCVSQNNIDIKPSQINIKNPKVIGSPYRQYMIKK